MKISVFGSGYVGLVAAAGFADSGHHVLCVDVDEERVRRLSAGEVPFFEPGLRDVVLRTLRDGRLSFATALQGEHLGAEVYFIAVGTPPREDGHADVGAVHDVAATIARMATCPAVIGVKSTVPVGTCDALDALIARIRPEVRFHVASVPEFLKEGSALADFFKPDRVVLGVADPQAEQTLRALYRPLQLSNERLLVTDRRTSELSKYAANAMLAARISFMNEMSRLCDAVGADVHAIRHVLGADERIGRHFLYAGPGFGGSCLPKDTLALAGFARDAGAPLELVEAAIRANAEQQRYVLTRALSMLGDAAGKTIAVWGLAFKAETDDVRSSPAAPLVASLLAAGARVQVHDPEANETFLGAYGLEVALFDDEYQAAEGADLLVLMTEWRKFRSPDFERLRARMRAPRLLDARNIWSTFRLNERGFDYAGVGTASGRK